MNRCCVIVILCLLLIFLGITVKFTTKDTRIRLYDAGLNYFEIQKENMNKTIQESMKNFESFLNNSTISENGE